MSLAAQLNDVNIELLNAKLHPGFLSHNELLDLEAQQVTLQNKIAAAAAANKAAATTSTATKTATKTITTPAKTATTTSTATASTATAPSVVTPKLINVNDALLARMSGWNTSASNVKDSASIKNQGVGFINLVTISDATTVGNISNLQSNSNLAFMETGSLISFTASGSSYVWKSPLATTDETATASSSNVIGNNQLMTVSSYDNTSGTGIQGTLYISPLQGKCILQYLDTGKQDSGGNEIYTYSVYYNPMNRSKNSSLVSTNMNAYCQTIGNIDPGCFCIASTDSCAKMALGGDASQLQTKSPQDYTTLSTNCAYLSPLCQLWSAASDNDSFITQNIKTITNSIGNAQGDGISICGATYSYDAATTSLAGPGMKKQCGITSSDSSSTATATATPTTKAKTATPTAVYIGVGLTFLILAALIVFFVMKK